MIVINSAGRQFFVRVVFKGDRYGMDDCLTYDKADPMIEFYDRTYAGEPGFGPRGQFVSRYNSRNLMDVTGGLILDGGVNEWRLDAEAVRPVVKMAVILAVKPAVT